MTQSNTMARDSRFELMRIIAMLMIVANHVALPIMYRGDCSFIDRGFLMVFGSWGLLGACMFVLVSCYFCFVKEEPHIQQSGSECAKDIWTRKVKGIVAQTLFYILAFSFLIPVFTDITALHSLKFLTEGFICDPLFMRFYWFVTAYIILQFALPFIKRIPVSKSMFILCNVLLFVSSMSSVDGTIADAVWFILIAVFFMHVMKMPGLKTFFEKHAIQGFLAVTGLLIAVFCIRYFLQKGADTENGTYATVCSSAYKMLYHIFNYGRYSYFIVIDSVFLFYAFLKLKQFRNRTVNSMASSMFGVYLFHQFPGYMLSSVAVTLLAPVCNNNILLFVAAILLLMVSGIFADMMRRGLDALKC